MIILSGVLVVVAIALLVAGIVAGNGDSAEVFGQFDALFVIYVSIGVSIVSALCLAIGVFLRRKELFGTAVAPAPARTGRGRKAKKDRRNKTAPAGGVPEAADAKAPADDEVDIPAPPVDVPDDALVFVVRGRKRYHLDTCRQLAGRETEELTYAEAKEEGFSPCTACMPDTALAARAAASAPASPDAGEAAGDVPAEPGAENAAGGLAGLAKSAPSPAPAPTPFDKIAENPRPEPARDEAERRTPSPAGPTLTDMPVASLFTPDKPAAPAEKDEPAAPQPADGFADERPAEAESAPTDDAEPDPAPEAAAPKPRDADDEADDPEPADEPDDGGPQVRILSGTKRYHRTDCALIEDIGDEADDLESLSRGEAKSRGCTPCLVCQPDREHARD